MNKALALILITATSLLAAHPASAGGMYSSTFGFEFYKAQLAYTPVGGPAPLMASGIPSIIVLAAAGLAFRRRRSA